MYNNEEKRNEYTEITKRKNILYFGVIYPHYTGGGYIEPLSGAGGTRESRTTNENNDLIYPHNLRILVYIKSFTSIREISWEVSHVGGRGGIANIYYLN